MDWPITHCLYTKGESFQKIDNVKGIYRLYDVHGTLLYIGIASNLRQRIREHIKGNTNTKYFSSEIQYVAITYSNIRDLHVNEKKLIKVLQPKYNRQYKLPNFGNRRDLYVKFLRDNGLELIETLNKKVVV